jgi:Ca-activated chloride channel homolog
VLHSTPFLAGAVSVVEARLTLKDSLPADNSTWAVLNVGSTSKVLLVTPGNVFLSTLLETMGGLSVTQIAPKSYSPAAVRDRDLVIFDGFLPGSLPPANLLLINPPHDTLGMHVGTDRQSGAAQLGDDPNGLLRYVTPSDIHVFRARNASSPDWASVALRDRFGPLMLEGLNNAGTINRHVVVMLFDLSQSDLPLGLDFPVLASNLLTWLAPGTTLDKPAIHPGDFIHAQIPSDGSASVTGPDGMQSSLNVATGGQLVFGRTDLPGNYTLSIRSGATLRQAHFVVNPVLEPIAANDATGQIRAVGGASHSRQSGEVPFELTGAIALVAIVVLSAEWFVAMRLQ